MSSYITNEEEEDADLQRALVESLIESDNGFRKAVNFQFHDTITVEDLIDYTNSTINKLMNILLFNSIKDKDDVNFMSKIIYGEIDSKDLYCKGDISYNKNNYDCTNDNELRPLPNENSIKLLEVVFGSRSNILAQEEDICRWINHTIEFQFKFGDNQNSSIPDNSNENNKHSILVNDTEFQHMNFCLIQQGGGPCGILSTLNGYIIKQLVFNPKRIDMKNDLIAYLNNISEENCWYALIESLCIIIFQSSPKSRYRIIQFKNDTSIWRTQFYYVEYKNIIDVYNFYMKRLNKGIFSNKGSLFSILLTVIESRTVEKIKSEMDDINNPLVGLFGHCNQELVNLFITGSAVSNVFDDIKILDGSNGSNVNNSLSLKGIQKKSLIGYLTEHEALQYCTVGLNYKYPLFPIWIIGNKNHYKCCFTFNFTECILTPSQELTQFMSKTFQRYDTENCGFILDHQIESYLSEINMYDYLYDIKKISENGIVLWSDMKSLIFTSMGINGDSEKMKFWTTLYLFDGQKDKGIKLIKSVIFDIDGYSTNKDIYDKLTSRSNSCNSRKRTSEEFDLINILQTRWSKDTIINTELLLF